MIVARIVRWVVATIWFTTAALMIAQAYATRDAAVEWSSLFAAVVAACLGATSLRAPDEERS